MKKSVLKIFMLCITLYVCFFTLILRIGAKEVTKTHYKYYYFIEPYNVDTVKIDENGNKISLVQTENTTYFHRLPWSADEITTDNFTRVDLSRLKQDNVKTFNEFFVEYNQIKNNITIDSIEIYKQKNGNTPVYCLSLYKKDTPNVSLYRHGCYKFNGIWSGGLKGDIVNELNNIESNNFVLSSELKKAIVDYVKNSEDYSSFNSFAGCASVNREVSLSIKDGRFDKNVCNQQEDLGCGLEIQITRGGKNRKEQYEISNAVEDYYSYRSSCPSNSNLDKIDDKVYSPVLYKFEYQTRKHVCEEPNIDSTNAECNSGSVSFESKCTKLTIEDGDNNYLADVKIEQKGHISNILTPNTIYNGGGIKIGFMYYNTLNWSYNGRQYGNFSEIIPNKMKDMLKKDFANQIEVILKGNNSLLFDRSLIQKKCETIGEFNEGETVSTICTIFLPEANLDLYTGKVSYINASGEGINNKYYLPLKFSGKYAINASIEGLNRLDVAKAKGEKEWTANFSGDSCNVDVYKKYPSNKFIYRPIDLSNPFPNRNAGINWYEWYSKESNQERLKNSYNNKEYMVTLNPSRVKEIKNYNNNNTYFDWNLDEYGKSSFIHDKFSSYFGVGGSS